jgi:hypothetical protein
LSAKAASSLAVLAKDGGLSTSLGRIRYTTDYEQPLPGKIVVPLETITTSWGTARHIQVSRADGRRMPWSEILRVVNTMYPGESAAMVFPPADAVIDRINAYHLWVPAPPELRLDKGDSNVE